MARLNSVADLRRIVAEPRPTTFKKILDALDEQSIEFLKRCPFALIGTTTEDGTIEVSPKGDEPGFIRVEDPKTLLIPERVGNNLAFGLSNIVANGKVGLTANLSFQRKQIAAAVEWEDRRPPRDVTDRRLNFDRPEAARIAEGMRLDLARLLAGHGNEKPAPRRVRALPDPDERGEGDHVSG